MLNGAVQVLTNVMKNVVSSAEEAEVGALFNNLKEGVIIRTALAEMGWPQPVTPVQTDNTTANSIANNTCKQQRSKAIDMRHHWVKDRAAQKQFRVHWAPGSENLADYHTKHHAPIHHQRVRPLYLHQKNSPPTIPQAISSSPLQGCVKTCLEPHTQTLGLAGRTLSNARNVPWVPATTRSKLVNWSSAAGQY